jgi:acetoacetyl-CoA synthetase
MQHMKEHALHANIHAGDKVFYFTTCGWMMWNWLTSALAQEAVIVLYEGNPSYPSESKLWQIAEDEQISLMGVSAKYIDSLRNINFDAKTEFDLSNLRSICSTGSPLSEDGYAYIYEYVKPDVHLASISGGTDIVSCFALGSPVRAVRGGVLQMRGLGMSVEVWTDDGRSILGEQGELVCTKSFPSMPVGFGNDPDDEKYRNAYFEHFDGVWRHGDWATLTNDGGLIIHGRSDATLNPGGVRIGTAEIYRICEKFSEIKESMAIGLMLDQSQYIVMFLVLNGASEISAQLEKELVSAIRTQASPRHVPSYFMAVPDLPKTRSGKISELAVRDIIHGKSVKNINSLSNPEILKHFEAIAPSVRLGVENATGG